MCVTHASCIWLNSLKVLRHVIALFAGGEGGVCINNFCHGYLASYMFFDILDLDYINVPVQQMQAT